MSIAYVSYRCLNDAVSTNSFPYISVGFSEHRISAHVMDCTQNKYECFLPKDSQNLSQVTKLRLPYVYTPKGWKWIPCVSLRFPIIDFLNEEIYIPRLFHVSLLREPPIPDVMSIAYVSYRCLHVAVSTNSFPYISVGFSEHRIVSGKLYILTFPHVLLTCFPRSCRQQVSAHERVGSLYHRQGVIRERGI
jgi:hypothetical protein